MEFKRLIKLLVVVFFILGTSVFLYGTSFIGNPWEWKGNDVVTGSGFTGNIGIGTTTPNNLIQVFDLINFNNTISGTFLGYQAGKSTTGLYNTFIGYQAGISNVAGAWNTALGYGALYSGSGSRNVAVGAFALLVNTSDDNVAVGTQALYSNVGGNGNTAIGPSALYANINGTNNVAVGDALRANVSGIGNMGVGSGALNANTLGNYNVGIGGAALLSNLTGNSNVAIGFNSLLTNTAGISNIAIGTNSLFNATGSINVAIGEGAGWTNPAGSGNVFIGFGSGYYETGSNKLFIDNQTRASEADGRVKALVYGVFDANPANQIFTINGNVGIRTITPQAMLHIYEPTPGNEVFRIETATTGDDPNYRCFQNRVATTDATVTAIYTITLNDESAYLVTSYITARRTTGSGGTPGDSAGYTLVGTFKRTGGGTATQVGATIKTAQEDQAAWDADFGVSGNNVLVNVTGALNNTITWHANIFFSNLSN